MSRVHDFFRAGWVAFVLLAAAAAAALPQEDLGRLYNEARAAQAAGDLAAATRKYEDIVRLRPDMAEAHSNLGNLYYQQRKPERAKAAYRKAIELKPDLAGPHFFLGVIAFEQHDYAGALRFLKRAGALEPSNALIHSYLGYAYYARSAYGDAVRELETAADLESGDMDVFYHLSKSYAHLAKDAFALLQQKYPDSAYANLARAHFYESEQNWTAAGEQYGLALQKLPGNSRLEEKVRWAAARSSSKPLVGSPGQPDELIDASLAYLYSPPSGARVKQELAEWRAKVRTLAQQHGDSDKPLYLIGEDYQILSYLASLWVFQLDPESYRAHQLRAQLLEASNKDEDAIVEYRRVLELKPDLPNVHFAIGTLYWKDQHFDQARPELEHELRLNPNHPQALYELGDILVSGGKTTEAENYFLKAVKLEPNMVELHLALEKIYTQAAQYEKALEHLRKAMKIDPADPTPHYRLAAIYRKLGRTHEADTELRIFNQRKAAAVRPQ